MFDTRILQNEEWILYTQLMGSLELVFGIVDELQIKMTAFGFVSTESKIWEYKNEK